MDSRVEPGNESPNEDSIIDINEGREGRQMGEEEVISRLVEEEIQKRRHGEINKDKALAEQQQFLQNCKEHENTLKFLQDSLQKNETVTENMVKILDDFDSQLSNTLNSINLINDNIMRQQKIHTDISDTIKRINDYLHHYDAINEYGEEVDNSIEKSVSSFLEAENEIVNARKFFEMHDDMVQATEKLRDLYEVENKAKEKLKDHFYNLLSRHSQRMLLTPEMINSESKSIELIPEKVRNDLALIAERLDSKNERKFLQQYEELRSTFLKATIAKHFGFNSSREKDEESMSEADIQESEDKKKSKKIVTESDYGQFLMTPTNTGKGYQRGTHVFLKFIDCILLMLNSESIVANDILPAKSQSASFRRVIDPVMEMFSEIGNHLLRTQLKHPDRVYGTAVLLDIWGHLSPLRGEFGTIVNIKETRRKITEGEDKGNEISLFWKDLEHTITNQFEQFLQDVKNDQSKPLPSDGTVHALTSNTINYLVHLTKVDSIQPSYKQIAVNLLPFEDLSRMKMKDYITNVLSNLKDNLENKARRDKTSPSLSNIFKLNNYYFIWKKVKTTDLVKEVGKEELDTYKNWTTIEKNTYFKSWEKAREYLAEDWKPSSGILKGIGKSKPNEAIKERFNGFNNEIKELFEAQQTFFIADEGLRSKMREGIRKLILPGYINILDKYKDVHFTKRVDDYMKYKSSTLEEMIMNEFFEGRLKSKTKLQGVLGKINRL